MRGLAWLRLVPQDHSYPPIGKPTRQGAHAPPRHQRTARTRPAVGGRFRVGTAESLLPASPSAATGTLRHRIEPIGESHKCYSGHGLLKVCLCASTWGVLPARASQHLIELPLHILEPLRIRVEESRAKGRPAVDLAFHGGFPSPSWVHVQNSPIAIGIDPPGPWGSPPLTTHSIRTSDRHQLLPARLTGIRHDGGESRHQRLPARFRYLAAEMVSDTGFCTYVEPGSPTISVSPALTKHPGRVSDDRPLDRR